MTDIMKLIGAFQREAENDGYKDRPMSDNTHEAKTMLIEAIEALQAENERLKQENETVLSQNKSALEYMDAAEAERDALAAKLDELQRQVIPIGGWKVKVRGTQTYPHVTGIYDDTVHVDLPATPKALEELEPREQRADWLPIANALDHAVRELGRTKEASTHDWNTAVHVFEFARGTTCTCCSSPMQWPAAYRCLDCKAVLCETCAPIHFGPDHSKRAAEAHKGN